MKFHIILQCELVTAAPLSDIVEKKSYYHLSFADNGGSVLSRNMQQRSLRSCISFMGIKNTKGQGLDWTFVKGGEPRRFYQSSGGTAVFFALNNVDIPSHT